MAASRMARFEVLIGTWNTTGEVFATENAPATVLSATDSYRWFPGKQFIVHDVDARFGLSVSRSMEIMGYDRQAKRFVARSFDDQGVSETFDLTLNRRRFRIVGAAVRFNGLFDSEGARLEGLWEIKGKQSGWQPWIQLVLERA
jgi:hypothetical protein